jgi:hypothetical protein
LSLYRATTPLPQTPTPSIIPIIGPYSFSNCQTEGTFLRAPANLASAGNIMTNELCASFCAGYGQGFFIYSFTVQTWLTCRIECSVQNMLSPIFDEHYFLTLHVLRAFYSVARDFEIKRHKRHHLNSMFLFLNKC